MDKIWDRKSFEVGGHWPLWRGWKNEWPRRTDKSRTLKLVYSVKWPVFQDRHRYVAHLTRQHISYTGVTSQASNIFFTAAHPARQVTQKSTCPAAKPTRPAFMCDNVFSQLTNKGEMRFLYLVVTLCCFDTRTIIIILMLYKCDQ